MRHHRSKVLSRLIWIKVLIWMGPFCKRYAWERLGLCCVAAMDEFCRLDTSGGSGGTQDGVCLIPEGTREGSLLRTRDRFIGAGLDVAPQKEQARPNFASLVTVSSICYFDMVNIVAVHLILFKSKMFVSFVKKKCQTCTALVATCCFGQRDLYPSVHHKFSIFLEHLCLFFNNLSSIYLYFSSLTLFFNFWGSCYNNTLIYI